MKGPCPPNCPRRRGATKENPVSCHTGCEIYESFWAENRKASEERLRQNELDDLTHKGIEKIKRAKRLLRGKQHP